MTMMGMKKDPDEKKKGMQRTMFHAKGITTKRKKSIKKTIPGAKKKRKVKTPLQKLHDKCWAMAKKVVQLRDHHQCQHCFKPASGSNGHTSHVLPKSTHGALKYVLDNLKLLCYHCHINWWHKNPIEAGMWFKSAFPERWDAVKDRKRTRSYRIEDLEEILEELTTEYDKLTQIGGMCDD